jgi:hypothetical protein
MKGRVSLAIAVAAGAAIVASATALASGMTLKQISSDPFTNTTAIDGVNVFHQTEEEPDTFAVGSTIVSAFQVARFHNGGADDIGFATSTDGGRSWKHGFLPGTTFQKGVVDPNPLYERVSDASVAFDAKHGVWLISSIPLTSTLVVPTIFVSRSSDGLNWSDPVSIPQAPGPVNLDKNWTVCDNTATTPAGQPNRFYGNCYTEFDNFATDDLELLSTSSDGGLTWSLPISTPLHAHGLGGQPLVQPNGNVVVPFESIDNAGAIAAFGSTDGGATLTNAVTISAIDFHRVAGDLRTSPLPTAEIDGAGTVYVAWEDCAFEAGCPANDIVFSHSSDGVNWSGLSRVPANPVGSGVDHFIPGLGVDKATSGDGARLALTYYYYPNAACTVATCQLDAAFISSTTAGATWSTPLQLAGPMNNTWLAFTTQGYMVGDYISTSILGTGQALTTIAVASFGTGPDNLNEAMFAPSSPLDVSGGNIPSGQAAASTSSNLSFVVGPTNR